MEGKGITCPEEHSSLLMINTTVVMMYQAGIYSGVFALAAFPKTLPGPHMTHTFISCGLFLSTSPLLLILFCFPLLPLIPAVVLDIHLFVKLLY